jgi:hypothetical protein
VAEHDISREDALEIARLRTEARMRNDRTQQMNSVSAAEQESQQALTSIAAWAKTEMTRDAKLYEARKPMIEAFAKTIQGVVPASQWPEKIAAFYNTLPKPARPPAPARPTITHSDTAVRVPKDDMEAFDIGLAKARTLGY